MIFHDSSKKVYDWLWKQPHVKEESLTDWLLYNVSENCHRIYYQAFSRHEEAKNGADWEWWVLTSNNNRNHDYYAYRFLIQAKKLFSKNQDNYSLLSYGNKNGAQIDLLLEAAKYKNALPLYMYYSIGKADAEEQIKNNHWLDTGKIWWCENCIDGCYISLATKVYEMLYDVPRHKLTDSDLLNHALKLSLLDMFFDDCEVDVGRVLSTLNYKLVNIDKESDNRTRKEGVSGIKHFGKGIPDYLKVFIKGNGENMDWFENQMRMTDIGGIGVIDFRDI